MKEIAIIGAGAAGLFAAKKLSEHDDVQVTVYERSPKAGTKLRASGGGRANILNTNILPHHYNDENFIKKVLEKADYDTLLSEFEAMGLKTMADEEGRVYPSTLFAPTVVNVLLAQLGSKVDFRYETPVLSLKSANGKWRINDEGKAYDTVIMASGSPAGMVVQKQKGYNHYLSDIQIKTQKLAPSLTGFIIRNYPKSLFGCRVRAEVSLFAQNQLIFKEKGEVIFKEDGISGIVILNASAYYNRLENKDHCHLSLNLLPNDATTNVKQHLQQFGTLAGILHPKLCQLYERHPFDLRDFKMEIEGLYGIDSAQVCSGGILTSELTPDFQLKRYPGLYAIGEMVDIDGVCGGYNLFFAFASALIATESL